MESQRQRANLGGKLKESEEQSERRGKRKVSNKCSRDAEQEYHSPPNAAHHLRAFPLQLQLH